jgi:hypothetical protein
VVVLVVSVVVVVLVVLVDVVEVVLVDVVDVVGPWVVVVVLVVEVGATVVVVVVVVGGGTYGTVFSSIFITGCGSGSMMTVSVSLLRVAMMPDTPCVHGRWRDRLSSGA